MIRILRHSCYLYENDRIFRSYERNSKRFCSQKVPNKYPRRIFSGIQPTGSMHLGNYFGAVKKWVELQDAGEDVIWSIVDMHSITLPQDPEELRQNILDMTATLLACGIDPDKSILFQQSTVSMHAEFCWILGCLTTMPRLARLPQYKEKSTALKEIPLGLYTYPVLQAADILLYRATDVPVGEDQVQHLQLAQHLAQIFNGKFGKTFNIPHAMINDDNSIRIKSLRDPVKKMSKSSIDTKSRIDLTDEPEEIIRKMKKAVTDFTSEVTFDPKVRPGVSNLITIHSLSTGKSPEDICTEVKDLDTGKYKFVVAEAVIDKLKPIRERLLELKREPQYLEDVLRDGGERATTLAMECWLEVRNKIGFGTKTLQTFKTRKLQETAN